MYGKYYNSRISWEVVYLIINFVLSTSSCTNLLIVTPLIYSFNQIEIMRNINPTCTMYISTCSILVVEFTFDGEIKAEKTPNQGKGLMYE